MLRQRLDNGTHITDRHALRQQILQHLMQRRQRHHARHQIFRQLRHLLAHAIQQLLRLLTTKQLAGVLADQMVQVRRHHGARFHHGKALNLRLLFQRAVDPDGGKTKCGIDRLFAGQGAGGGARVDRHPAARISVAAANLDPFHQNAVARRRHIHIVADMHHRRQKAHLLRELLTNTADTAQQLAVLRAVHHRDQAVAHFHTQRIFQLHVAPGRFHCRRRLLRTRDRLLRSRLRLHLTTALPPGQAQQRGGKQQEHQVRHPRHQAQQPQHASAQHHHTRVAEQLGHHLLAHILIGADARDDNARRGGNHQRRDLRHQAVADGQQRIAFRRRAERHAVLHHAHQQAAHDVDNHNHDASDGVAAHKLTGTVH